MKEHTHAITTYSENKNTEGKVLIIGCGGAGILKSDEQSPERLNEQLRLSMDHIPYLREYAEQIHFVAPFHKDSADLTTRDVSIVNEIIQNHQNNYDGFVIIAGSDTMPFFSSATAFSLRGLGMPIIFIGARQRVLDNDSDLRVNLPNAIKAAVMGGKDITTPSIGEVGILFDDSITRATTTINRGLKVNNPMESPRVPKIADVGWTVKIQPSAIQRHPSQLNYSSNTNTNIAYFDLVSETHLESFELLVESDTVQGIVIGAFGAGNIPSKMIPSIHKAVYGRGKAVAVITNCKKGSSDMGLYDCGALALKAGAISLGPMVKPAAIEKMRYALNNAKGNDRLSYLRDVARLLLTEVAHEFPYDFSRYATNKMKYDFLEKHSTLNDFYKPSEEGTYSHDIKKYCTSVHSPYKILVLSTGGTFFQEVNPEGSLTPTKTKTLSDLFDKKFKELSTLASIDYAQVLNKDSTELCHADRLEIAKIIVEHIEHYDGFIILHGTDTMSYTAASLSFMLVNIPKDVIITGAQRPGFGSSDFDRNFIKSIKVIITRLEQPEEQRIRPGIKVAFGDKIISGTTVAKVDEHGMNAFGPAEKHPVAGILGHIIELVDAKKEVPNWPFAPFFEYDTNVAYFECFHAIDIRQFERLVEHPSVSAILIGGYDEGNIPINLKYYISTAVNTYGKPVALISNTDYGVAHATREGRVGELIKAGVITLGDMIRESAFQKLCYAVGLANKQTDLHGRKRMEFIRKVMQSNIAGEISNKYLEQATTTYKGIFVDDERDMISDDELRRRMNEQRN